jgi:hypothetical protein
VLTLAKGSADGDHNGGGTAAGADDTDHEDDDGNGVAIGLGIAGLIAGLAGLGLGGLAFARTRNTTA